jgi:hypothetical protein
MSVLQAEGLTLSREEREKLHLKGILPLAKSILTSWGYEWALPGHGEPYYDCGSWRKRGCLNVDGHVENGLFENMSGKVYIELYKRSCVRAECPTCYEAWAGKEAHKIEHRLRAWSGSGKIIHVIASPPKSFWVSHGFEDLRRAAYVVVKESGLLGGSCIFHPFREDELTKRWYFSPHFHFLGFGWIRGTKEGYARHGWVVKNAGIRKTVHGTAMYQLSHAGVHESCHTVTWFGAFSYNKLQVPPLLPEEHLCPLCGQKLRPVLYYGEEDIAYEEGGAWYAPEGWRYKIERRVRAWAYG